MNNLSFNQESVKQAVRRHRPVVVVDVVVVVVVVV